MTTVTLPDGRQFVLAEIDDFESEMKLVREQDELMAFLDARSNSPRILSLDGVKATLDL